MKIALIIPPRHKGKWVSREYKDGYYDLPHPPYLMLSIAGLIRQQWPEAQMELIDAQLEGLGVNQVRERVAAGGFDAAVVSLGIISIRADAPFTHMPCPTIGVLPAYLDKAFALERYDLGVVALTHTEPEWSVLGALRALAHGTKLEKVEGLYLPSSPGAHPPAPAGTRPMHLLPMPAFDLAKINHYLDLQEAEAGTRYFYLFTSRGCPFNRYFCAPPRGFKPPVTAKTPQQVVEEIEWLYNNHGVKHYYFMDDEFALDMDRAKAICRGIINRGLKIRFVIYNHVNLMDEELARLLAEAGCTFVRYGVETASPRIAGQMNKPLDIQRIKRTFRLTKQAGMGADAFFLLGFPGEGPSIIRLNRALIRQIKPDRVTLGIVFPKPYSRMYHEMRSKGVLVSDDWSELFADRLCFRHSYWRDTAHLRKAFKRFHRSCQRWCAWWQLWDGSRVGLGPATRLIRWLKTLPAMERIARSRRLKQMLRPWYKRPSKLEL